MFQPLAGFFLSVFDCGQLSGKDIVLQMQSTLHDNDLPLGGRWTLVLTCPPSIQTEEGLTKEMIVPERRENRALH